MYSTSSEFSRQAQRVCHVVGVGVYTVMSETLNTSAATVHCAQWTVAADVLSVSDITVYTPTPTTWHTLWACRENSLLVLYNAADSLTRYHTLGVCGTGG